ACDCARTSAGAASHPVVAVAPASSRRRLMVWVMVRASRTGAIMLGVSNGRSVDGHGASADRIPATHEYGTRRSMDENPILVEQHDGYRVLTLNRPQRLNAFTEPMHVALR